MADYQPFVFGSIWNDRSVLELNRMSTFLGGFDAKSLLEFSYNLFNKDNAGTGSIDSNTGEVEDNSFRNTGYIPLMPNTQYVMTSHGSGAFYNSSKERVSGIGSSLESFTTDADVYYMSVTLSNAQVDTFMVHEGTALKEYMEYGVKPAPLILAPELKQDIEDAKAIFSDFNMLTINKGDDYPLRSVQLGSQAPVAVASIAQDAILSAVVSGAKAGYYYRLTFIANGITSGGKERYGISVGEYRESDGTRERWIFLYNDDETPENQQNANIQKKSDGIDTIIVDNGEFIISLTVDRAEIAGSSNPTYVNLVSGAGESPSAVIDPSTYTSF